MKKFLILFFCIIPASSLFAHSMAYDFSAMSRGAIGWVYLRMGFLHIIPQGFDHILFIVALFLIKPRLKAVLAQATLFTIAHTITLGLALYGIISPPSHIVEPIIALSIVFVCIENTVATKLNWWRYVLIFVFGLIHGCGFAGALAEAGLPQKDFLFGLLSFNAGVELGQAAIIAVLYILTRKVYQREIYRSRILIPASMCIAMVALYWTFERIIG
jgi:hypothetical protein